MLLIRDRLFIRTLTNCLSELLSIIIYKAFSCLLKAHTKINAFGLTYQCFQIQRQYIQGKPGHQKINISVEYHTILKRWKFAFSAGLFVYYRMTCKQISLIENYQTCFQILHNNSVTMNDAYK